MKNGLVYLLLMLIIFSCKMEENTQFETEPQSIKDKFSNAYSLLPEMDIASNTDSSIVAFYAEPTEKYGHGILGDRIEAEQLVVMVNNDIFELVLDDEYVFEDIRPRLYDVDGDDQFEFITIRTHVDKGAGIAIYKIENGELYEYANVDEIGIRNRWLNIATVHDLDNDGIQEIAWIQTPHIGGILKVAKIKEGILEVSSEQSQYSNHAIGERNLCLSTLIERNTNNVLYVPNQTRNRMEGFFFENDDLIKVDEIPLSIDFTKPLINQYDFENEIPDQTNCIH